MNNQDQITTCQICARPIKAKSGFIAHHGYTRPGYGWQTASCFGAQYKPYEVSRDAIKLCISSYETAVEVREQRIKDLTTNPPATLTRIARSSYDQDETYEKPADFNAAGVLDGSVYVYYSDKYAAEYRRQVRDTKRDIEEIKAAIKFLEQRYDAWEAK